MKEIFLLLPGWTRSKHSYSKLISLAPQNSKIMIVSYEEIVPNGDLQLFDNGLLKVIAKFANKKVNLVGHSVGGALAIEFTVQHPRLVNRLILIDSAGVPGNENPIQLGWKLFRNLLMFGSKKLAESVLNVPRLLKQYRLYTQLGLYAHKADLQSQVQKIGNQTLILWGEKDCLTPLWQGKRLHNMIPHSKLVVLKGMDHDWILHAPEKFWESVI